MTKKHFEHAARFVASNTKEEHKAAVCAAFLNLFTTYNPRFAAERFIAACGLTLTDLGDA